VDGLNTCSSGCGGVWWVSVVGAGGGRGGGEEDARRAQGYSEYRSALGDVQSRMLPTGWMVSTPADKSNKGNVKQCKGWLL
jgi:hypothetical protein